MLSTARRAHWKANVNIRTERVDTSGEYPDREMTPFTSDDSGHGVAESRIVEGFIESILNDTKPPIDVYEAMDYTAPGTCAHLSAERDGAVVPVPNYR